MGQPWGRLYTGTRNHRKFAAVRRKHKDTWTYLYVLMECSFETDDEGKIYVNPDLPYSIEELADEIHFHKSPKFLRDLIETAVKVGLISYKNQIPQWLSYSERQFKSDHSSAERVRKYREKLKSDRDMKRNGNVTCNGGVNGKETDTEYNTPPTPPNGGNGVVPFQKVQESWNRNAPPLLPRIKVLDEKRKRLIKATWLEHPDVSWFDGFFRDIALSDHHSGKNDRGWSPDIGWILKERVRLQEKFESLKQGCAPAEEELPRNRHGPDCPRCKGLGTYQSGLMPDGSKAFKVCDYPYKEELRDGPQQAVAN